MKENVLLDLIRCLFLYVKVFMLRCDSLIKEYLW